MCLVKVGTSGKLDIFTKPLQLSQFLACLDGILSGKSGHEFPPTGPSDSGGGK